MAEHSAPPGVCLRDRARSTLALGGRVPAQARRADVSMLDCALCQRLIDEALVPYLLDDRGAWTRTAEDPCQASDGPGQVAKPALMVRLSTVGRHG